MKVPSSKAVLRFDMYIRLKMVVAYFKYLPVKAACPYQYILKKTDQSIPISSENFLKIQWTTKQLVRGENVLVLNNVSI